METLVTGYGTLNGYYKLNLSDEGRVMIELNVPEECVLCVKDTYLSEAGNAHVETVNKVEYTRKSREDIEALILSIKPEWVVAIRSFKVTDRYVKCITEHYVEKECPAWIRGIMFDSSYPVGDDGYFVKDWRAREEFYRKYGMKGCPMYYTIKEALYVCNDNTVKAILTIVNNKSIGKDSYDKVTIADLLK